MRTPSKRAARGGIACAVAAAVAALGTHVIPAEAAAPVLASAPPPGAPPRAPLDDGRGPAVGPGLASHDPRSGEAPPPEDEALHPPHVPRASRAGRVTASSASIPPDSGGDVLIAPAPVTRSGTAALRSV